MSDTPQGPNWWQASNCKWYDPSLAPPGYVPPAVPPQHMYLPRGPNWWQASDGKWYPPEQAPHPVTPPAPIGAAAPMGPGWWLASDGLWYEPALAPTGQVPSGAEDSEEQARPIYKQWWFWTVAAVVLFLAIEGIGATASGNKAKNTAATVVTTTTVARPSTTRPPPTTRPPATTTTKPVVTTTTVAPTTVPPSTTSPPATEAPPSPGAPAPAAAAPACDPQTDTGGCYEPGEFCRTSDRGSSGTTAGGQPITCEDNDGWRWEYS
jgi:hypothetical protein